MIVGSLLLILVAVALLADGLMQGSNPYLIGSVSASLLAAVALIAGGRQAARAAADDELSAGAPQADAESATGSSRGTAGERRAWRRAGRGAAPGGPVEPGAHEVAQPEHELAREPVEELVGAGQRGHRVGSEPGVPAQGGAVDYDGDEYDDDEDPPDEPPPQLLSPADAALVARMSDEVLVIDGRPRYHLEGCVHLRGRQFEPLPVSEAVELGFTPCSRCEPDSTLLAQARRV